jgi:hypothetical protein
MATLKFQNEHNRQLRIGGSPLLGASLTLMQSADSPALHCLLLHTNSYAIVYTVYDLVGICQSLLGSTNQTVLHDARCSRVALNSMSYRLAAKETVELSSAHHGKSFVISNCEPLQLLLCRLLATAILHTCRNQTAIAATRPSAQSA